MGGFIQNSYESFCFVENAMYCQDVGFNENVKPLLNYNLTLLLLSLTAHHCTVPLLIVVSFLLILCLFKA